jgi:N-acetylneuraminate synthase/N,N'-diacetyllegionaminate synthase
MLRRLSLRPADFRVLKVHAEERKLIFLSTPHDEPSAELLEKMDVVAFKIASGDVTNHPLLKALARTGRPLLLSTGMSDLEEVAAAVRVVRHAGRSPLALLHCVSSYPAPAFAANLRAMAAMRVAFGVPVGYSDHTLGVETALAAVALGACILEKHLTLDRSASGPDHAISMDPVMFRCLVDGVRRVEAALGSGIKTAQECERDVRLTARKSLHFTRDVPAGTVLGPDDVEARRPGDGIAPSRLHEVIGRTTRHARAAGTMVAESDLA